MMMLKQSPDETLRSEDEVAGPSLFKPLDEQVGYQELDAYFEREAAKQRLADASRIDDEDLLDRLLEFGFTPLTLPALQLAPIAFVAWASESVSNEECQAAVASIYEAHLFDRPAAAAQVQKWLDRRPSETLWELWEDVTTYRLSRSPRIFRQTMGDQLLRQAKAVAIASGGWLGFGKVCEEEREVIDAIHRVFFRHSSSRFE